MSVSDERKRCEEYGDSYYTIGLGHCPDCDMLGCWLNYLRWERKLTEGGKFEAYNKDQYHKVAKP